MKRAAVILTALWLLCSPVLADGALEEALGLDGLAEAAPELMEGLDPADADLDSGLARLRQSAAAQLGTVLKETLRPLAGILAVCLLCALAGTLLPPGSFDAVNLCGCLAVAVIGAEDVRSLLRLGSGTLEELLDFSRVLLPTLTTAAAVSGMTAGAGASYAAAALFSDLLLSASEQLILPMLCAYTAASIAEAVLNDRRLDGAVQLLQWLSKLLMKGLVIVFTAYLSLTGILSAAADAAAVKAAKAALSAALPVVGKLMSEASSALVAGAGLVRSAVGVYGLVACMALVLLPVLRLGVRYVLFRAAAAVCGGIADPRQARLVNRLSGTYGMLLGLVGSGAIIEFLAIIALIRTVTV